MVWVDSKKSDFAFDSGTTKMLHCIYWSNHYVSMTLNLLIWDQVHSIPRVLSHQALIQNLVHTTDDSFAWDITTTS